MKIIWFVFISFFFLIGAASAQLADSPWPTFHGNLQRTGLSPYDTSHVDGTILWTFKADDGFESSPVIGEDGTIYIGSHDGYLYAVTKDGEQKWKTKIATPVEKEHYGHLIATSSTPAIDKDGTVYISSMDQYLFAINPDGTEKWRFSKGVSFDTWASPAIGDDGTIYITSSRPDAGVYAVNPDGTEKWHYSCDANPFNSPAIGKDGIIYAGVPSSFIVDALIAFNEDGSIKWESGTDRFLESTPTVADDGTIYVGSFSDTGDDAGLYAISSEGEQKWYFNTQTKEVMATPAIGSDGTIYVGDYLDEGSRFHAFNPDGTEKWGIDVDGTVGSSAAIGAEGTIYFAISSVDEGPNFYAANPDGSIKWSITIPGSIGSSPAIDEDGTIYVGSWDGNLYAIGAQIDKKIDEVKEEDIFEEKSPMEEIPPEKTLHEKTPPYEEMPPEMPSSKGVPIPYVVMIVTVLVVIIIVLVLKKVGK